MTSRNPTYLVAAGMAVLACLMMDAIGGVGHQVDAVIADNEKAGSEIFAVKRPGGVRGSDFFEGLENLRPGEV